jgi:hypothetical protein
MPLIAQEIPPARSGYDLVGLGDAPSAMRETLEYFLLKTGRTGIGHEELAALRALEGIHTPARVNKEIALAVDRFEKKGRHLSRLTLRYIYMSLRHQNSLKNVRRQSQPQMRAKKETIADPYAGCYL